MRFDSSSVHFFRQFWDGATLSSVKKSQDPDIGVYFFLIALEPEQIRHIPQNQPPYFDITFLAFNRTHCGKPSEKVRGVIQGLLQSLNPTRIAVRLQPLELSLQVRLEITMKPNTSSHLNQRLTARTLFNESLNSASISALEVSFISPAFILSHVLHASARCHSSARVIRSKSSSSETRSLRSVRTAALRASPRRRASASTFSSRSSGITTRMARPPVFLRAAMLVALAIG